MNHIGSSRLSSVLVKPASPLRQALEQLDHAGTGALLLSEDGECLLGVLTDGDIRRAILRGVPLEAACQSTASCEPIVSRTGKPPEEYLRIMNEFDINHLPLLDGDRRLHALVLRSDLGQAVDSGYAAVVMAGGYGKRLLPLTENLPKPMLPVNGQPLLELTIGQLRAAGIRRVNVTTHHLADSIVRHFGDGSNFGVRLSYVNEAHPLGTVGGLRLLPEVKEPMLVINGDILTGMSFRAIFEYHRQSRADMTVAVREIETRIPYGVIDCDGPYLRRVVEKPVLKHRVNAGIYVVEPSVYRYIPEGRRFDMTDLIERLLDAGRPIVSFPIVEYWLDVGQPADYQRAQEDVRLGKLGI